MFSAKNESTRKATEVLGKYRRELGKKVESGVRAVANHIYHRSQDFCPVDTGTLKADGHVRQEGSGLFSVFVVGYGTKGYAVFTHSNLERKHVWRTPEDYAVYAHETRPPSSDYTTSNIGTWDFLRIPTLDIMESVRVLNAALFAGSIDTSNG